MKYENENQINDMISAFESGVINEDDWHHNEHLIVAARYLIDLGFEPALNRMRTGIHRLLKAFGVDESKPSPYHETLTVFWMRTVEDFIDRNPDLGFFEICRGLTESFPKNYAEEFYSRELLFSDPARAAFVVPDLRPLPGGSE